MSSETVFVEAVSGPGGLDLATPNLDQFRRSMTALETTALRVSTENTRVLRSTLPSSRREYVTTVLSPSTSEVTGSGSSPSTSSAKVAVVPCGFVAGGEGGG